MFVRVVFLEGAMEKRTLVPEAGARGGQSEEVGWRLAVGGRRLAVGGDGKGVTGLLENDRWKIADLVVPPIAIAGAVKGCVRIA